MKDGSMVRITDREWLNDLTLDDCVGWDDEAREAREKYESGELEYGEDTDWLIYCRELASGVGEITDEDFDDFDDVWVTFGSELMLAVPKRILECVDKED